MIIRIGPRRGSKLPPRWPVAVLILAGVAGPLFSWLYPEHRKITAQAIEALDPARRAVLDQLWTAARRGHESRLAERPFEVSQGSRPDRLDLAAWPAIGGDHSCSAENMLQNILRTDWILKVARSTGRLEARLAKAKRTDQRTNAVLLAGLELQKADPEYVTRAVASTSHFISGRAEAVTNVREFMTDCTAEGAGLNAIGIYVWYHLSALAKAERLSREPLAVEARSSLALAALADEAFGLHFLEDSFAAGHVTRGAGGGGAYQKGTHDYYNEHGFATETWSGTPLVLMGDAWMRPEDAARAATAVRLSLEQLLDAAAGKGPGRFLPDDPGSLSAEPMNICRGGTLPGRRVDPGAGPLFAEVLLSTPKPSLASGPGMAPRYRTELGPFIGIVPAAFSAGGKKGFGAEQTGGSVTGGLEVAVRLGVGLEGIINEGSDGLVFLDLGFRQDANSSASFGTAPGLDQAGALTAAVPARPAFTARLRLPFWLIPGDLILAAPLYLISPSTYMDMAVVAANGGLLPWQAGLVTSVGRFQFILGREVGVSFFGYGKEEPRLIVPTAGVGEDGATLIALRSIQIDFPILEYRPFRSFSVNQSSSLAVQVYGGMDIPTRSRTIAPAGAPVPDLNTAWHFGLRVAFDWRRYLR